MNFILEVCPEREKYVTNDKMGYTVLYVCLNYDLYGFLNSLLLFWGKSSKDLESQGFKLNPYDSYIAKKITNGHQFTILWYMEYLKISHKGPQEVSKIILWIEHKHREIQAKKGKLYHYLGMILGY